MIASSRSDFAVANATAGAANLLALDSLGPWPNKHASAKPRAKLPTVTASSSRNQAEDIGPALGVRGQESGKYTARVAVWS